jgi:hypothetical protein
LEIGHDTRNFFERPCIGQSDRNAVLVAFRDSYFECLLHRLQRRHQLGIVYVPLSFRRGVEGDFLSSCGERVECENDSGEGLDVGKRGEFFEDCSYGRFVAGVGSSSRLPLPTNISKDRDRSFDHVKLLL